MKGSSGAGSEKYDNEARPNRAGMPILSASVTIAQKPLFEKVLDITKPAKKKKLLASLDPITAQPKKLYLHILKGETGANQPVLGGIRYSFQSRHCLLSLGWGRLKRGKRPSGSVVRY